MKVICSFIFDDTLCQGQEAPQNTKYKGSFPQIVSSSLPKTTTACYPDTQKLFAVAQIMGNIVLKRGHTYTT
jgi:hypothetical protein